jgi:flagellar FliL protein
MADDTPKSEQPGAAPARPKLWVTILGVLLATLIAGGAGGGAGIYLTSFVEKLVEAKAAEQPAKEPPALRYSGDLVLERLDPVVTNLAEPDDTWIRMEASIVFPNGALPDPHVTVAEIRQDILAYTRTIALDQLEGPSALQHLREDLNERVAIRTGGLVRELIVETLVLQ